MDRTFTFVACQLVGLAFYLIWKSSGKNPTYGQTHDHNKASVAPVERVKRKATVHKGAYGWYRIDENGFWHQMD